MNTINNQKFGEFLQELRKEKNLTQKDVAEHLGLSDKAVSKWERGLSFPDITLLEPIANFYNISLTELYHSEKIDMNDTLHVDEINTILHNSLEISNKENEFMDKRRTYRNILFLVSLVIMVMEITYLIKNNYFPETLLKSRFPMMIVALVLLSYFTFFVKTKLPIYYDNNKISFYSQYGVRFHIAGLALNNNNWQKIINTVCISTTSYMIIAPIIIYLQSAYVLFNYSTLEGILGAYLIFTIVIPTYVVGKMYK